MKTEIKLIIYLFLIFSVTINGRSFRVSQLPNGSANSCSNCHVSAGGGGTLNDFGRLVQAKFLNNGNVNWNSQLASMDADNDGVSNGEELQDRFGDWSVGMPNPGNVSLVRNPGLSLSNPLTNITINFDNMLPVSGKNLYLRIKEVSSQIERVRRNVISITNSFSITAPAILKGHSYTIDFFIDLNGNNLYDGNSIDNAFSLSLNNASGEDVINFSFNNNFTEIEWSYLLNISINDLSLYSERTLEYRLVDNQINKEIFRGRVESINADVLNLKIPKLALNKNYNLEYFIDIDNNGLYNNLVDKSWKNLFINSEGDHTLQISANDSQSLLDWNYLFTLNMSAMQEYVLKILEMRIVDKLSGEEIGRINPYTILTDYFSVSLPNIQQGKDYSADFFIDINGNGVYDAPPIDNAWRVEFMASSGNSFKNFKNNTSFVDINWIPLTSIDEENIKLVNFSLDQNYPNPFNPNTIINFNLQNNDYVSLNVYDLLGNEVATLYEGKLESGNYSKSFDAKGLSSGIYFYKLQVGKISETKKMILLR